MTLRAALKSLLPPVAIHAYRRVRFGDYYGRIWRGIYSHYRDVPRRGDGFEGVTWFARTRDVIAAVLSLDARQQPVHAGVTRRHMLMPLVASLVCRQRGSVRVLDFGGGLAWDFVHLRAAAPACSDLRYWVVESPRVCAEGSRLFAVDSRITFLPELPPDGSSFDIVLASGALQFIEDWRGVLARLCRYQAEHLLLLNLPAGAIPTFAAEQHNVRGSVLAAWFFNFDEVVQEARSHDYELAFKAASEEQYAQDGYPESHRIGQPCHLLFVRRPAAA